MQKLKLAVLNSKPEIFHTLQGEGVSMGMPAVFVRSSLCNLHCIWCDTDYTWNWENTPWEHENDSTEGYKKFKKSDYIVETSVEEIAEQVLSFNCPNMILTGGEPLLQQQAWLELMKLLRKANPDFRFEVETNGTQLPSEEFASYIAQFNISAKLANSNNSESLRIAPKALAFFAKSDFSWFKFVIAADTDLDEVHSLIEAHNLPKEQIILMPEGRTPEALQARRLWLADLCRDQGFRFADRLHIQLWGSKRGV